MGEIPENEARFHTVVRGEYLFKILRAHGLDETLAQVAMDLMACDPKAYGLTSGSVHVVYPGDIIRLPAADAVQGRIPLIEEPAPWSADVVAPVAAASSASPLAAPPSPAGPSVPRTTGIGTSPSLARRGDDLQPEQTVSAVEGRPCPPSGEAGVEAARRALQDGSLDRLSELLELFHHRSPSPPLAEPPILAAALSPPRLADVASRLRPRPRPEPAVKRPSAPPIRPSVLDELPRYGLPFTPVNGEDAFNVHRPYCGAAPELWLGYHSCPSCQTGTVHLCVMLKLLDLAQHWDEVADAAELEEYEAFDTRA